MAVSGDTRVGRMVVRLASDKTLLSHLSAICASMPETRPVAPPKAFILLPYRARHAALMRCVFCSAEIGLLSGGLVR